LNKDKRKLIKALSAIVFVISLFTAVFGLNRFKKANVEKQLIKKRRGSYFNFRAALFAIKL